MTPLFPVVELFDRLAIAEVKWERTHSNKEELDWYTEQAKQYNVNKIRPKIEELKIIHDQIWNLESDLRNGVEQKLGLEEIGRRAILIRDFNAKRIQLKNTIAELLECPVREIKKDHLSR